MANFGDRFGKLNAIRSLGTNKHPAPFTLPTTAETIRVPPETDKRILCLWFPNWPIQRLVVAQPELRRKRIVLFRRDSRRGQLVSAVSPMAMQNGVCLDMPLSEAKSLLRPDGHFYLFEHEPVADQEALKEMADEMELFSPIAGLETLDNADLKQGRRHDSLLLDISGLAHLFGNEQQLARQTMIFCDRKGYLPRVAVANTVGLAWAVARHFSGQYFREHDEPLIVTSDTVDVIHQLPVAGLRLESSTLDTLYQLGIHTVGQLQQLSRNDLAMRFGLTIHRRLDQLTGKTEEPVVARRKPVTFQSEQLLEFPTHHRETIEVIISRQVEQLCGEMKRGQRGALEWNIQMTCVSSPAIEFRVSLFQPSSTVQEVMPLIQMQLEQALSPVTRKSKKRKRNFHSKFSSLPSSNQKTSQNDTTQPRVEPSSQLDSPPLETRSSETYYRYTTIQIQEISVSVTSDVLLVQQQRELFDENPRLDRQSLAHLINRLASRLGPKNVLYPSLQSGAQPEFSYRFRPLVDPSRKRRRSPTKPPNLSHKFARPLRLISPPQAIEVVMAHEPSTGVNSSRNQPPSPALISWTDSQGSQQKQAIMHTWGPERIETGWWRGRTVCRDYWRLETESQQHYWVYQDLRTRSWYLHGEF